MIIKFIKKLIEIYGDNVKCEMASTDNIPEIIPEILRDWYKKVDSLIVPFGEVYPLEIAIEKSKHMLYQNKVFCFGKDYEDGDWLCLYTPDKKGRSFNVCFSNIPPSEMDALYSNIIEFLDDLSSDFCDDPWNEVYIKKRL